MTDGLSFWVSGMGEMVLRTIESRYDFSIFSIYKCLLREVFLEEGVLFDKT